MDTDFDPDNVKVVDLLKWSEVLDYEESVSSCSELYDIADTDLLVQEMHDGLYTSAVQQCEDLSHLTYPNDKISLHLHKQLIKVIHNYSIEPSYEERSRDILKRKLKFYKDKSNRLYKMNLKLKKEVDTLKKIVSDMQKKE